MKPAALPFTASIAALIRKSRSRIFNLFTMAALFSLAATPALGARPTYAANAPDSAGLTWSIQNVDAPQFFYNMSDHYMRFDSLNYPHLAYGGNHLYYLSYNGTSWNQVVVDSLSGVGQYASLALDKSYYPHISYYDAVHGTLKYAFYTGSNWQIQTVDGPTPVNQAPSSEKSAPAIDSSTPGIDTVPPAEETVIPTEETVTPTERKRATSRYWRAQWTRPAFPTSALARPTPGCGCSRQAQPELGDGYRWGRPIHLHRYWIAAGFPTSAIMMRITGASNTPPGPAAAGTFRSSMEIANPENSLPWRWMPTTIRTSATWRKNTTI